MLLRMRRALKFLFSNSKVGAVYALLLGLAGTAYYARVLDHVYPIKTWLFWQLATIWAWMAIFSLACSSFGQLLLVRVLRLTDLPVLESAVLGMASGVVAFTMAMYVAGALALFGPIFAAGLPVVMLAVSAREGLAFARRILTEYVAPIRRHPMTIPATIFGILCVGVIYLQVMTPDSLNYDSTWSHLTVAQDYARMGRIVRFPGDYNKNMPQLGCLIHTWDYLVPGLDQPALRWMMILHSEFGLFLWTLAGVAAGICMLLGDHTLRGTWASFFLFPIIFVYDHNLGGANDHICAFFSVPFLLAMLRFCRDFSPRRAALLAAMAAGMQLTKYQAIYVIVPAIVLIALHGGWRLAARRLGQPSQAIRPAQIARSIAVLTGLGAVLVAPHFLRNLIFYKNPVYPFLANVFTGSTPHVPNGEFYLEYVFKDYSWRPQGTLLQKFWHALELFWSFSFEPHYSFTKNVPAFGSLFTLLLPLLPFVRHRFRIAQAAALASGALLIWGLTFNVDRNLQVFMPLMVCVTGALVIEGFRLGWLARLGILPLVGLQLVWGGDALFYSGADRIRSSIDLIRSGFEGRAKERLNGYRAGFIAVGNALPADAKVVLHSSHLSLGINRELVLDWTGFQGLISYSAMRTPQELFQRFKDLGITHLVQVPHERPSSSKQEEVLWDTFVAGYATSLGNIGGHEVFAMPSRSPPKESPYRVAAFGLSGYSDGVYPVESMGTIEDLPAHLQKYASPSIPLRADAPNVVSSIGEVDAVFVGPRARLNSAANEVLRRDFHDVMNFGSRFTLYVSRRHTEIP
jgi:hypothetical protein